MASESGTQGEGHGAESIERRQRSGPVGTTACGACKSAMMPEQAFCGSCGVAREGSGPAGRAPNPPLLKLAVVLLVVVAALLSVVILRGSDSGDGSSEEVQSGVGPSQAQTEGLQLEVELVPDESSSPTAARRFLRQSSRCRGDLRCKGLDRDPCGEAAGDLRC
jgi:hypothetical protein